MIKENKILRSVRQPHDHPGQIDDKGTILYSHDESTGTLNHYSRYDHTAMIRQPDLGSCLLSVKGFRGTIL